MDEQTMVTVPGLDVLPGADWMFECDGCGVRVRSDEELRGMGDIAKSYAREIMSRSGWSFRRPDRDMCPECTGSSVPSSGGTS